MTRNETIAFWILLIVILSIPAGVFYYYPKIGPKLKDKIKGSSISGVVVPHHNLVADIRAKFFSDLSTKITPKTIILLSPNHYSAGLGKIQTTDQVWDLGKDKVLPDDKIISLLVEQGVALNEPASFGNEHGIYNILADIKNNFPTAELVPLIFKDVSLEKLENLEKVLNENCSDCLMIASVDFSHYQPALLADLHDDMSLRYLENLDTKNILTKAEVDSGPSLALLTMWARDHNTLHFHLQDHTNSGIIYENPDLESTTHLFGWYESGTKVEPERQVSFIIGGDMMFDRYIYHLFSNNFNDAFDHFGERVFWGTDAAFANLEGAITMEKIIDNIEPDNLTFQFSPNIIKTLNFLHLNAMSMANNHSDNAGVEGENITRTLLNQNSIQTFGGSTEKDASRIASFEGQGLKLFVIGINLTYQGQTPEPILPIIKQLKEDPNMRVIVMSHWGIEYELIHSSSQSNAAHMWVDAGADMVVGSHPHVIQDAEIYKGAPIIYSLGNLLFDQTQPNTTRGLLVAGKFTSDGLMFFGLPVESVRFKPQLMSGAGKNLILDSLYSNFKDKMSDKPAGDIIKILK